MKEKIIEILRSSEVSCEDNQSVGIFEIKLDPNDYTKYINIYSKIADEILALGWYPKEFVEWKDNFADFDIETQLYAAPVETHVIEWKTLDELYKYWFKNIKI